MTSLPELAKNLANGTTTSRALVESCLAAIEDTSGEGARAFMSVNADAARAQAERWDERRKNGQDVPPFAGIPMALKDLYDVEGEITRAGSKILSTAAPATKDAPSIHRLRSAGFIFIGRTTMVEFAFGGLGQNPHHGTPLSVFDRETGRLPGGSSSGSAVAVADGMAAISMGTDTGGSCRIPAAFNGLTGYKPTASRIPTAGVYPLSFTLDSVGPIGHTVACCAAVDAMLSANWTGTPETLVPQTCKIGVVQNFVLENLDATVARVYAQTLNRLSEAGFKLVEMELPPINDIVAANINGGIAPAEAWTLHRERLEHSGDEYDPRVGIRMRMGEKQTAADYIQTLHNRKRMIDEVHAITRDYDAVVMPTVAHVPPALSEIADPTDYIRLNMLTLRNTSIGNFLDRCAISVPVSVPGDAPVGLMLMGEHGGDEKLFAVAQAVETALAIR